MRKYMVYLEDRDNVYRLAIPAQDQQDAIEWSRGNGDLVAVKDVTGDYSIRSEEVADALMKYGFSRTEVDFLVRALDRIGMTH